MEVPSQILGQTAQSLTCSIHVIMPSDLRHIAMVLFVNMTAVYGQVNELSYMVATIGSLQNCDIQVNTIF